MAADGQVGTRNTIRNLLHGLEPVTRRAGSAMLASGPVRARLNAAYDRSGPRFRALFIAAFANSRHRRPFHWECRFAGRSFVVPVVPNIQRSWNAALAWGWAANRGTRAFYELFLNYARDGVFLDVGANDGMHSYPFAAHGYKCICVEPQPACVEYIERVRAANGFDNLRIQATAVSNVDGGEAEFFVSDATWFSSLIRDEVEQYQTSHAIRVPLTSIDTICRSLSIVPTLIKIDVEGVEVQVLEGAAATLQQWRPAAVVEVRHREEIRRPIWRRFNDLGYRTFAVHQYAGDPFRPVESEAEFLHAGEQAEMADFIFLPACAFRDAFEAAIANGVWQWLRDTQPAATAPPGQRGAAAAT